MDDCEAQNNQPMRLIAEGGDTNVGLGYYFSDNRIDSSSIWIWRHRRRIGGHCQVLIRAVLGDVRDLFSPRTEGKRSTVISIAFTIERLSSR